MRSADSNVEILRALALNMTLKQRGQDKWGRSTLNKMINNANGVKL